MNEFEKSKWVGSVMAVVAVLALFFAGVYPALAAPPANDDIASATLIPGVPFSDYIDTSEATVAPDDPYPTCNYTGIREATVWYQFTPSEDKQVVASTAGSDYTTNLAVYPSGSMTDTACALGNNPIGFQAMAGQTYNIMIAAVDGGPYAGPDEFGGQLNFSLDTPGPPQAYFDYWSDGPYSFYFSNQSYDPAGASMTAYWEFGDGGTSADWSPSHQFPGEGTYMVSLTVTTSDGRTASTQREVIVTALPPLVADFGYWTDYYSDGQWWIRFDNYSYDPSCYWCWGLSASWDFGDGATSTDWSPSHQYPPGGTYTVSLTVTSSDGRTASTERQVTVPDVPPPPNASFNPYPGDPSIYDIVYFENFSYDPGCYWCGMSAVWDLGDGTTSTAWTPSHQYAADGDYTVSLTVTTADGRTGSTTRDLQVRTHDVAITKFTVPQSAKAGQTRSVTVDINNTRYPEQVQVELYKSTIDGWQWVGSLQLYVPVRPSNRTTSFAFSYTFTAQDAELGRINFRAVANIVNARDALPTNNEAISLPTKVAK
jgi:PKD repeat protein